MSDIPDHRRIGASLDLFSFPEAIGSGLPVFHPRGGIVRETLMDYCRTVHRRNGYETVSTPHVAREGLFHTSGHLPHYADSMFGPIEMDGEPYRLKAMNCPMHHLVYRSRGRSHRDLPLRLFELGTVYRNERSGVVGGLTRVRGLTMDDAHIYTTRDQLDAELFSVLGLMIQTLDDFRLADYTVELSTRDDEGPSAGKYIGDSALWAEATETLSEAARGAGLPLVPDVGGAAFYGPKVSVQCRDSLGRSWQMGTIQLDFNGPERFGLDYTGPDGHRHRPVVIHRALLGSVERFLAVLLEHCAGVLPAWLAPVQVVLVPVDPETLSHLMAVAELLGKVEVRAEVDDGPGRMGAKVARHQRMRVPFTLVAGERERLSDTVSVRFLDGTTCGGVPVRDAVRAITTWISTRAHQVPSAGVFLPLS